MRPKRLLILLTALAFLAVASYFSYVFLNGANATWKPGKSQALRSGYCRLLGGEMKSDGCGIAGCIQTCKFPYKGADKPCQSSADCSGKCVVTSPANWTYSPEFKEIPAEITKCQQKGGLFDCSEQNFKARCQKEPLVNCETAWEYDHGLVKKFSAGCIY